MQSFVFEDNINQEEEKDDGISRVGGSFIQKSDNVLDQLIRRTSVNVRMKLQK
jgi:hypothetical protein